MIKKILTFVIVGLLTLSAAQSVYAQPVIRPSQGGTGVSTYSAGDILYASTTNPFFLNKLPIGSNGLCLVSNGTLPTWASCSGQAGTNFFTESGQNIFLNTGSNLQAARFQATSTTASIFPYASTTAISATTICLTGDLPCKTAWPTGGGGSGNVATSSTETSGRVPFWTSSGATPATLSGGSAGFTFDGTKLTSTYASSTGATATTLFSDQAVFNGGPWVDVRTCGAKGDGVTNDVTAIDTCISNLSALGAGGGTVFLSATAGRSASTKYRICDEPITMKSWVDVVAQTGVEIEVCNGFATSTVEWLSGATGTFFSNWKGGLFREAGTPQKLWTAFNMESQRSTGGVFWNVVEDAIIYFPDTCIRNAIVGSNNGWLNSNTFKDIVCNYPTDAFTFEDGGTQGVFAVSNSKFDNVQLQANSSVETCWKDVKHYRIQIENSVCYDMNATSTSLSIASTAIGTVVQGGYVTSNNFVDNGTRTVISDFLYPFYSKSASGSIFVNTNGQTVLGTTSNAWSLAMFSIANGSVNLCQSNSSFCTPIRFYYGGAGEHQQEMIKAATTSAGNPNSGNLQYNAREDHIFQADVDATSNTGGFIFRTNRADGGIVSTAGEIARLKESTVTTNRFAFGIGTTSPYAELSVVGHVVGARFTATTSEASVFPYASSTALTVSGSTYLGSLTGVLKATSGLVSAAADGTDYSLITALTCSAGQHLNSVAANGDFTCSPDTGSGGGSGGGTWSTTTSQVANQNINYSNANTDIVAIGGTATTSADYWFDPNVNRSYLTANVGIGTTSASVPTIPLWVYGPSGEGTILSQSGLANSFAGMLLRDYGNNNAFSFQYANPSATTFPNTVFMGTRQSSIGTLLLQGGTALSNLRMIVASSTDTTQPWSGLSFVNTNVGVGTTSPYKTFSVNGASIVTDNEISSYFTATSSRASTFPYASTTALSATTICWGSTCTTAPTISGITLGSNLGDLTAGDSSITFSGTYNGSTARNIILNVGNANVWTALQSFTNANSILATGSTTLQNFTGRNATTTQATTTNLYVSGTTVLGTNNGVLKGTNGLVGVGVDGTDFTLIDAITCSNQVVTAITAAGVSTCSSINNAFWSGTDLSVANGGTGLSTFGGSNTILYTTAADTLASEAAFTYNQTDDRLTSVYASTTALSATTLCLTGDACRTTWPSSSSPGGSDTQVQFNDGGSSLGGDAGFTFNKTADRATVTYASTTGTTATSLFATTICLSGDTCRTTWPSGGSGTFPFDSGTNFGVAANSTTTQLWLRGFPWSLTASSSVQVDGNFNLGNFGSSGFTYASSTASTTVSHIEMGSLVSDYDPGIFNIFDILGLSALSGTQTSGCLNMGSTTPNLCISGIANGSGGFFNQRVGIGSTTPTRGTLIVESMHSGTTTIIHGSPTKPSCDQWFSPNGTAYREYVSNAGAKVIEAGYCQGS